MTQPFIKNIFFLATSCLLFFIDLIFFASMQQHQIDLLFCFFIVLLITKLKKRYLIWMLFLLSIFSYLDTNIFGWSLLYLIPIIALQDFLDQHLHVKWIIPYSLLTAGLILKFALCLYTKAIALSWVHATEILVYNCICLIILLLIHSYDENSMYI